jgi:hypothetical protein
MNRMFQVIVVGGIALTADACGSPAAVADHASSGGGGHGGSTASGGFPHEGAIAVSSGSSTTASSSGLGPFDPPDAGPLADSGDASVDVYWFPGETQ